MAPLNRLFMLAAVAVSHIVVGEDAYNTPQGKPAGEALPGAPLPLEPKNPSANPSAGNESVDDMPNQIRLTKEQIKEIIASPSTGPQVMYTRNGVSRDGSYGGSDRMLDMMASDSMVDVMRGSGKDYRECALYFVLHKYDLVDPSDIGYCIGYCKRMVAKGSCKINAVTCTQNQEEACRLEDGSSNP